NPVGQHFGPAPGNHSGLYEIIGVAADLRSNSTTEGAATDPRYFLPEAQTTPFPEAELESRELWSHAPYTLSILAPNASQGFEGQLRDALAEIDPDLVVYSVQPFNGMLAEGLAQQRMILILTALFGLAALALAAVGLYGVTAYNVQQRIGE